MRDEETGSWWQQVNGQAIQGPMKGTHLQAVRMDEIAFARWSREQANGRVLRPDPAVKGYATPDWEARMQKMPVATRTLDKRLAPRELVVGVVVNGRSK